MEKLFATLSIIFTLLFPTAFYVNAQEEQKLAEVVEQLNQLLTDKNYEQAFLLADQNTFEYGGITEFDLLTGFAAYGSGRYQEALFALERVVVEHPSSYLARTYLALTYQKVSNFPAALIEVNKLLKLPLNSTQKEKANKLKTSIERRQLAKKETWGHSLSGSFASDSNINSGTYYDETFIPNIEDPIIIPDPSKETSDTSYALGYSAYYQYPISQYQTLRANAGFTHVDFFTHRDFRRDFLNVSLAYIHQFKRSTIDASVFSKPLYIAGDYYRNESGINVKWSKPLSNSTSLTSSIQRSTISRDEVDIDRTRVAGSYMWRAGVLHSVTGHMYQDSSQSEAFEHQSKTVFGGIYQLTWPINNELVSSSYYLLEQHSYKDEQPTFDKKRSEQLHSLSSQLIYTYSEQLNLRAFITVQKKNSNVDIYKYNRTELGASWQYKL